MHDSYKKWLDEGKPNVYCNCPCHGEIIIKNYHKYDGIPEYILGHNWVGKLHTEETKRKMSEIGKKKNFSESHKENMRKNHKGMSGRHHTEVSNQKRREKMSGDKSPNWKGGISFLPYCPLFNESKKEEIRSKYNRRCYICSKLESEQIKEQKEKGKRSFRLSVHHLDSDKEQGCNNKEWKLVPLCIHCHNKQHNKKNKEMV